MSTVPVSPAPGPPPIRDWQSSLEKLKKRPRTSPEKLFAENQALLGLCLRRFPLLTGEDRKEATGAAMLGLWQAAQKFDSALGYQFATFAVPVIRHFIINHLAAQRPQRRLPTVSLETPVDGGSGSAELADMITDTRSERPGQTLLDEAGFDALLSALPGRYQDVLRGVYEQERLMEDIAREMGISKQRVGQMHLAALSALRSQKKMRNQRAY